MPKNVRCIPDPSLDGKAINCSWTPTLSFAPRDGYLPIRQTEAPYPIARSWWLSWPSLAPERQT